MHHEKGHMVGHPSPGKVRWGPPYLPQDITLLPGHQTCGPPTSDIWWWSLETCSNLFIWVFSREWHLVVATESKACAVSKQAVCILLESLLITVMLQRASLDFCGSIGNEFWSAVDRYQLTTLGISNWSFDIITWDMSCILTTEISNCNLRLWGIIIMIRKWNQKFD